MLSEKFKSYLGSERIDPNMFWGLVLVVYIISQIPFIGGPLRLLATWVHEFGHGLGAILSGGSFERMFLTPGFSGLAHTFTGSPTERIIVLLGGLLGPAIAGGFLLILSRRFGQSRIALFILSAALFATLVLWAGNNFTRITVLGFAVVITGIAIWGKPLLIAVLAHIIALSFCLNAVVDFGYFFMKSGNVGSYAGMSDTAALADIIGGPHIIWAIIPTLLSLLILYGAFKFSGGFGGASRRD